MSWIYVITNDINNKQYVGKTNYSIEKRFKEHIKDSKRREYEKRPLYNAMNKYGIEHFSIEQLEKCDESIVNEKEQYWIQKLNTYGKTGYNATLGGDSKHYYNYKEIANKYLELQNNKKTAEFFNCDTDTVLVACKQCGIETLTSDEVNKKQFGKKVAQLDKETKEIIKIYDSMSEAAKIISGNKNNSGSISKVCRGISKTALGYRWKFV